MVTITAIDDVDDSKNSIKALNTISPSETTIMRSAGESVIGDLITDQISSLEFYSIKPSDTALLREFGNYVIEVCDKGGYNVSIVRANKYLRYTDIKAARKFVRDNYTKGVDYEYIDIDTSPKLRGGQKKDLYLTASCFQSFCMMSKARNADTVRMFYMLMVRGVKLFLNSRPLSIDDGAGYNTVDHVRVGLCDNHHGLKEAIGNTGILMNVYAIVNESISGIKKSEMRDKLKLQSNNDFSLRTYLPGSALRLIDYALDLVHTEVKFNGNTGIIEYTKGICGTLAGNAETYLYRKVKDNLGTEYLSLEEARENIRNNRTGVLAIGN